MGDRRHEVVRSRRRTWDGGVGSATVCADLPLHARRRRTRGRGRKRGRQTGGDRCPAGIGSHDRHRIDGQRGGLRGGDACRVGKDGLVFVARLRGICRKRVGSRGRAGDGGVGDAAIGAHLPLHARRGLARCRSREARRLTDVERMAARVGGDDRRRVVVDHTVGSGDGGRIDVAVENGGAARLGVRSHPGNQRVVLEVVAGNGGGNLIALGCGIHPELPGIAARNVVDPGVNAVVQDPRIPVVGIVLAVGRPNHRDVARAVNRRSGHQLPVGRGLVDHDLRGSAQRAAGVGRTVGVELLCVDVISVGNVREVGPSHHEARGRGTNGRRVHGHPRSRIVQVGGSFLSKRTAAVGRLVEQFRAGGSPACRQRT